MTRSRHILASFIGMLLMLCLWAAPARAESAADTAAARELFKEASQLSKAGEWEEAKDRFKRSLALKRAPITHFSLAIAQHKTGELVEALESFRAFLVAPPEPATDQYRIRANEVVEELDARVARVTIAVSPADAEDIEIQIDGAPVPVEALTRPRLVNPGEHVVTVSARGFHDASQSFEVAEGGSTDVSLSLDPAPEDARDDDVYDGLGPTADGDEKSFPTLAIVLMGVGGAALGAGIAVGMIGLSEASDAPTNNGEEADAARTKGLAGDIVAGVGGAALGVGVVLLIVHLVSDGEPSDESAMLRPRGAGFELRF